MARRKLWEKPAHPLFIPGVFGKTLSSSSSDLNKSESILRVNAGTEAEAVEGLGQSQFSPVVGRGQGLTGQGGEHLSRVFSSRSSAWLLFLLLPRAGLTELGGKEASEKSARL